MKQNNELKKVFYGENLVDLQKTKEREKEIARKNQYNSLFGGRRIFENKDKGPRFTGKK